VVRTEVTVDAGVDPQLLDAVIDGHQLVQVVGVVDVLRRPSDDVRDDVIERQQLLTYNAHLLLDPVVARRAVCDVTRKHAAR